VVHRGVDRLVYVQKLQYIRSGLSIFIELFFNSAGKVVDNGRELVAHGSIFV